MITAPDFSIQKIQLEEWRRKLDAIDSSYDRIRGRSVTLLTVQVGLIGYFISQLNDLIKPELYAKVFFTIGVAIGIYALQLALRNYRTYTNWLSPMYDLEIEKMNNASDEKEALQVLLDDYKDAYSNNLSVSNTSGKRLTDSLHITIASAIILLVLNFT